jgi:CheY-like chemotaxis protein
MQMNLDPGIGSPRMMPDPNSRSTRLNISALVIEDHAESARLLEAVLEPWGVVVITTTTAEEAELMLEAVRPDVILCDIVLPGSDGLTFVRRLRQCSDNRLKSTPAIALTAAYEDVDARTARKAGFDVFLRKPVDPDQLPHIVAFLVSQNDRDAN